MRKYNHSLDYTVLALAEAANGNLVKAGKLLVKASKQHDVKEAVAVIEASNAQAFERQSAGKKVAARKAVKASTRVRAFDIGDEEEIDDLIDDARDDEDDAEDLEEDEVDAAEEDEEEEEFTTEQFASMLRSMKGASTRRK